MSSDTYTEVTETSWFSRLGSSIKGIGFGILLFLVAFPLLFWNEGRAVKTARALTEGAGAVVSVDAQTVDPANEGKLVHVTGPAATDETLTDTEFGVSANAIKLVREVEMYQWRENSQTKTEKQVGGSEREVTTYTYERVWSERVINSDSFKEASDHQNPNTMPYQQQEYVAKDVTVGAFTLPESMVSSISNFDPLPVDDSAPKPQVTGKNVTVIDGSYYLGSDPANPQIGDLRVSFKVVEPGPVSIVARQVGNSFTSYKTSNGQTIQMVRTGTTSAQEMFDAAQSSNATMTWILRVVGIAMMFGGVTMVFKPISVLFDVLPILGDITGFAFSIVALLIALPCSLATISVAWLFYRPLLAIGLIVAGVVLLAAAVVLGLQLRNKQAPARA